MGTRGLLVQADNLDVLKALPDECCDLIYIDPPFNTGQRRVLQRIRTVQDPDGDRTGFGRQRYRTKKLEKVAYEDTYTDYPAFLLPRLQECRRVLRRTGSLYVHLDYREVHYVKVLLDGLFGRENFLNEIIWTYDYGARTTKRWAPKHDNILVYVKSLDSYYFSMGEIDRIPYLAPGLVGPEKTSRGKLPTDTWWLTIVSPTGKERTGYPTQKPLRLLRRIIAASCPPGGFVADFFAGSGTMGVAALQLDRNCLLVDVNPAALTVMIHRFREFPEVRVTYGAAAASELQWIRHIDV
ncbi:MAG: site-specific DNA-methyltransferase [Chloroflexi bacterium]|nr:site-specific DNA-methyltransferase [Chloroflexota bacterium]